MIKETAENIDLNSFNYELPPDRIAQYPVNERDMSQLLIYRRNRIGKDLFTNIGKYLPSHSLLVFNNTRVIRARILFRKATGAGIEVLCVEPLSPSEYKLSLGSQAEVEWNCIIGNLKKWKRGQISTSFLYKGTECLLSAEKINPEGDTWRVRFRWNYPISFGEVVESIGHIPLPPYINREDEKVDDDRYQTVYSHVNGSVAAPTAGLHFTSRLLEKLKNNGTRSVEITLHVGAGTFKPIKAQNITDHEMHTEHFFVTYETIDMIRLNGGNTIAVGTTSVRTLESLYWLGVKIFKNPLIPPAELSVGQWDAYDEEENLPAKESLDILSGYMKQNGLKSVSASTCIIIVPSYKFKIINGLITNFHQPHSTLLLLVSAWTGDKWKEIYSYALKNQFRFLSYGDCSLLL